MAERNLYTIPPDTPFLRALAEGLLAKPAEVFARTLILLPTRRACRSLRSTFLALNDGKPVLLPRMQPIGDVDQDELDLHLAGLYGVKDLPDIPPAMSSLKRLMLLGRLIRQRDMTLSHEQTLKLAASLATLVDQVHTENLDFNSLNDLVPAGELAAHWRLTLEFLSIITEHWPTILANEGGIDAADRRNRLMLALSAAWQAQPPAFPVIAAGSTGSIPATAGLLDVISLLPEGAVILPGLDQDLDIPSWDSFGASHPQATLRTLLNRLKVDRRKVRIWPTVTSGDSERVLLAREIMRPAETVHTWKSIKFEEARRSAITRGLADCDLIETRTLSDEAQAIAVIMRETLEQPNRTAALVTPDRELARRVSSALRKWDISVDDSAGCTLASLSTGQFLTFILACVKEGFTPLSLLNLMKHRLCRLETENDLLHVFESKLCHGPRPSPGLKGLRERALSLRQPEPAFLPFIDLLEALFSSLAPLAQGLHPAITFVSALIQTAEKLAGDKNLVWAGDNGEAAAQLLSDLHDQAGTIPALDLASFQDIIDYLLQSVTVRPRSDGHPRLVILGQLEARLIRSDVMILGSLNEGSWPAEARHDPWMSRPMRSQFGLPGSERSIGLSAHDFTQFISSPRVVLTRSLKIDGAATVPSRWLQRLDTLLKAANIPFGRNSIYSAWAQTLQHSGEIIAPAPQPEPCPPVETRPLELSATSIERWMKNPYHIYITKILRLRPLDPLDKDITAADRGSFVHNVLELFLKEHMDVSLPLDAYARLMKIAADEAQTQRTDSAEWQLWWPRFERLAKWFVDYEREWRTEARPWLLEKTGSHRFPTARGSFTLTARADRIDRLLTGGAAIIDYKTGAPPSSKSVASGENCQLPLEGLILRHGGYGEAIEPLMLQHWQVSGGTNPGDIKKHEPGAAHTADNLITVAEEGLKRLVAAYDQPDTPYTAHPPAARAYDEEKAIAHLSRVAEWGNVESNDDSQEEAE